MSHLRPDLRTSHPGDPALKGTAAYYAVYNAVLARPGLVSGTLRSAGEYCAIGSYFALPSHIALYESFIDEVAAVNDSVPWATNRQRRAVVLRYLRWKLGQAGMTLPGRRPKPPQEKA